jgi:hypothetical protein
MLDPQLSDVGGDRVFGRQSLVEGDLGLLPPEGNNVVLPNPG